MSVCRLNCAGYLRHTGCSLGTTFPEDDRGDGAEAQELEDSKKRDAIE